MAMLVGIVCVLSIRRKYSASVAARFLYPEFDVSSISFHHLPLSTVIFSQVVGITSKHKACVFQIGSFTLHLASITPTSLRMIGLGSPI